MKSKKIIAILLPLLFSFSGCGSGGGSGSSTTDDQDPVPGPTLTGLSTITDTGWNNINHAPIANKVLFTGTKYLAVGQYGYIAESTDGQSWTDLTIDTSINFIDLAVNGDTSAVAIADGTSGLFGVAATTDGTTWQIHNGFETTDCQQPTSVTHDGTQFVGIFDSTKICTSNDDGASWQLQSTQALAMQKVVSDGSGKYAFTIIDGLFTMDALDTTAITVPSLPKSNRLTDLIYANSTFVGIQSGQIIYSSDGINWSAVTTAVVPSGLRKLTYSTTKGFSALANVGRLYTSTDAAIWVQQDNTDLPPMAWDVFTVNGDTESLIFTPGAVYRSTDQLAWTQPSGAQPTGTIESYLNHNGTLYVLHDWRLYRSADNGVTWTLSADVQVGNLISIIHDGTRFIASGDAGLAYSDDGITWTQSFAYDRNRALTASGKLGSTTYYFGNDTKILSSDDGINFQLEANPASGITGNYKQAISDGSVLVAISSSSIVQFDGTTWSVPVPLVAGNATLNDIIWDGSKFITVGSTGTVMTSTDGLTWISEGSWVNSSTITDILLVGTTLYATDSAGMIASSTDNGASWMLEKDFSSLSIVISQLAHDGTDFYGFGSTSAGTSQLATSSNGTDWIPNQAAFSTSIKDNHIDYDTANSRFVTYSGSGEQVYVSADAYNWVYSPQFPADPALSYVSAYYEIAKAPYGPLNFTSGTPNQYTSGLAYSEDGMNWSIKTDQIPYPGYTPASGVYAEKEDSFGPMSDGYYTAPLLISTDGINWSQPTITGIDDFAPYNFHFIKYVNGQYVASVATSGMTGLTSSIYTSSDAENWTFQAEIDVDYSQWGGQVSDIEHDGTQYFVLFNDVNIFDLTTPTGTAKGSMILTTADLQTLELHRTGILTPMNDLIIDSNGYTLIGEAGSVLTHSHY